MVHNLKIIDDDRLFRQIERTQFLYIFLASDHDAMADNACDQRDESGQITRKCIETDHCFDTDFLLPASEFDSDCPSNHKCCKKPLIIE